MVRLQLLIDLSGTLHIGDHEVAGAAKALKRLQQAAAALSSSTSAASSPTTLAAEKGGFSSIKLRFCSNTTKESTQDLQARLVRAGFDPKDVPASSILTSLEACRRMCVAQRWRPLLLLTPSAQAAFSSPSATASSSESIAGDCFLPAKERPPSSLSDEERAKLRSCDTVVVGLAPDLFGAAWMDEAFRILAGEYASDSSGTSKTRLVATHRALYYRPGPSEPLSLGPGAYIAALEAASRREAKDTVVCGKPSAAFFQTCLDEMAASPPENGQSANTIDKDEEERNIVIGDDVEADLGGGAIEMGLERVLVRTGKYRKGDEDRAAVPVTTFDSFAHFVDDLLP
ncbi:hypothetical protein FA10DRAFT_280431 [Acaromyces ingoldii]|uniref:HAD-like protein n=1 Tax=Acaromyces ingoldii TaxID=215250 RepID=A0A316YMW1_9BASI|nr:hypothetical protein FA10DRAFT_280431 [Acaromyces ingoldii]PWN89403.1 hypothetical protein FA10DRAFT_280431 [Acaromyces ingoldii]